LIAQMIGAAEVATTDRVLEVGTGYGYQTALLARIAAEVVSIERWPELAEAARSNLERNGLDNVSVIVGDGWKGHPPLAPYDAIVVSAAASSLPEALSAQLAEGGRLVIPLVSGGSDDVMRFTKKAGEISGGELVVPARFVPLVRDEDQ
jgi:protein-L-isoaspartate(D-aspartate) O-methyltransferase